MSKDNPKPTTAESETPVPTDLRGALAANPVAKTQWYDLTPISRRDFISWIGSGKQEQTRKHRVEVACSKLESGQRRPCCYALVPMKFYKALGTAPEAKARWKDLKPNAKRDFIDWIESAKGPEENMRRIEEACVMLAAGKQLPDDH